MLDEMTSTELTEWREFYKDEPFGFEVDNTFHGALSCVIASTVPTKSKKRFKASDFMLTTGEAKKQTPEDILNIFKGMSAKQPK